MSCYLVKGKGWRFDFILKSKRHTGTWFRTKKEANQAEARKREELARPRIVSEIPTDMGFLELVNMRLDHVKAYKSDRYYIEYGYMAKRWLARWGHLTCGELHQRQLEDFILERSSVSACTANKEIRYLRSLFNYGINTFID